MNHYVVVNRYADDGVCSVAIFGVTHSFEEAQAIFNKCVVEERATATERNWEIGFDCDDTFEAWDNKGYGDNHTYLYIEEVQVTV